MIKGRIHSLESFGAVDGPGIRYLIFLKGCNMRCQYCHNVDTWNPDTDNLMTADELLDKAERFRSYWGKEGGITVSGGEALLQIDFLIAKANRFAVVAEGDLFAAQNAAVKVDRFLGIGYRQNQMVE